MIELEIQINSLIYSFLVGIIFNFLMENFDKIFKHVKYLVKLFVSLLFMFVVTIGYFYGLLLINDGIIHIYFLISLSCGVIFFRWIKNKWLTHFKKNNDLSNEKIVNEK